MRTIYIFSSAAHESDLARVLLTRSLEDLPESDDSIKDALQAFPRPIFLNAVEEYRGKPGSGKSQQCDAEAVRVKCSDCIQPCHG